MKKLLASTALVGALIASGSSFAETKFGGNVENTWTSEKTQTTAVAADSYDSIGTDIEIFQADALAQAHLHIVR